VLPYLFDHVGLACVAADAVFEKRESPAAL
jgi:hypothetical protein